MLISPGDTRLLVLAWAFPEGDFFQTSIIPSSSYSPYFGYGVWGLSDDLELRFKARGQGIPANEPSTPEPTGSGRFLLPKARADRLASL